MRSDTPEGNVVVQQSLIFAWVVITAQQQIATRIPKRFILSDLNLTVYLVGFPASLSTTMAIAPSPVTLQAVPKLSMAM